MKDNDKLHVILNNLHHSKSTVDDIINEMLKQQVPKERTRNLIDECLKDGSLIPTRNGLISTENQIFEGRSFLNKWKRKLFTMKTLNYLGVIIGILAGIVCILGFLLSFYGRHLRK